MVSRVTKPSRALKRTIALVIMTSLDICLGAIGFTIVVTTGWPAASAINTQTIGMISLVLLSQFVMRFAIMVFLAFWSYRLVRNAHDQRRIDISTQWAWLGFFVPVVSYWLPARTFCHLNFLQGHLSDRRRILILTWWVIRLLASPSAAILVLLMSAVIIALRHVSVEGQVATANWASWLLLTGLISQCLLIPVIILTYRRQPRPGHVSAAAFF